MNLMVPFYYPVYFLPTKRHRKERETIKESTAKVSIRELEEGEFPVALRVTDYHSVCEGNVDNKEDREKSDYRLFTTEYRAFGGKLYIASRNSYGTCIEKDPKVYSEEELISKIRTENDWRWESGYRYEDPTNKSLLTGKSTIVMDCKRKEAAGLRQRAKKMLLFSGFLWEEAGEPMYCIVTFGLGHNHGGTGFFIEDFYNSNIPAKNYYNAMQYEEAIDYFKKVAVGRGDTDSVKNNCNYKVRIEVLMPEMIKRRPMKDHGNGDEFLNRCESLISASSSPLAAGLLVMAAALK